VPNQPINPTSNYRAGSGVSSGSLRPWLPAGYRHCSFERKRSLLEELQQRAHRLKSETFALYLAARNPGTPWYAKLLVAGIVAYALSPIDLIPDFVPVLGYLDDLILIPMGIALAIKMIPDSVLAECRARAQETVKNGMPVSRVAGAVIVIIWLLLAALCAAWVYEAFWNDMGSAAHNAIKSDNS